MKKFLSMLLVMAMVVVMFAGCANEEEPKSEDTKVSNDANADVADTTDTEETDETDETQKFAIIVKNTGNPYNEKQMEGFVKAIEELGGEAILKAPDQPTAEAQIQMIEELIIQEVAGIAIAGNDPDALQPVLEKAMNAGIMVLSLDSAVNSDSRMVHVNQADPELIGRVQVQAIAKMIGNEGQVAVLSATSQATNQNTWIEWMKEEFKKDEYSNMELVKVTYGDDLRDKSVSEMEALLQTYPDLKGVIAPTTVGIAAAGKVITDKNLKGQVELTGLGLPSEMAEYIESGVCQWMYLWNPMDVGYLAGYALEALVSGAITGTEGDSFVAGTLGEKTVITVGSGTEIMLGSPYEFNSGNIAEWKTIY